MYKKRYRNKIVKPILTAKEHDTRITSIEAEEEIIALQQEVEILSARRHELTVLGYELKKIGQRLTREEREECHTIDKKLTPLNRRLVRLKRFKVYDFEKEFIRVTAHFLPKDIMRELKSCVYEYIEYKQGHMQDTERCREWKDMTDDFRDRFENLVANRYAPRG